MSQSGFSMHTGRRPLQDPPEDDRRKLEVLPADATVDVEAEK